MIEKTIDLSTIDFSETGIHYLNITRRYLGSSSSSFSTEEIEEIIHIAQHLVDNENLMGYGLQTDSEYYATLNEYEPKARKLLADHNNDDIDRLQELLENELKRKNELKRREEIEKAKDPNYIPF